MLADKLVSALDRWGIDKCRILMVVTDNGSKHGKGCGVMRDEADELEESCNDTGAAATTAAGDDDEEEEEEEEDDEEGGANADSDVDKAVDDTLKLKRFPCIAHTSQLVVKQLTKNRS